MNSLLHLLGVLVHYFHAHLAQIAVINLESITPAKHPYLDNFHYCQKLSNDYRERGYFTTILSGLSD